MSAYAVAAVNVENARVFAEYFEAAQASFLAACTKQPGFSCELIAADEQPLLLEGTLPGKRIVVFKFDSKENLLKWYNSSEYQEAKTIRANGVRLEFFVVLDASPISVVWPASDK